MADRRTASSSLSAAVINYLRGNGHTQADIARMLGVSEGFVSLVKSKERSLTIDHLELLAHAMSVPLGALLIAVTEPPRGTKQSEEEKRLFDLSAKIMRQADAVEQSIMRGASTASSR